MESPTQDETTWWQRKLQPLLIIAIALAIAVVAWAYNALMVEPGQGEERVTEEARITEVPTSGEVLYEVTGSALSATVTMQTPTGTQQADVSLPMRSKAGTDGLRMKFQEGDFVYISAQNQGKSGEVTCRITVDGVVISENTSSANYGIASCDGTA